MAELIPHLLPRPQIQTRAEEEEEEDEDEDEEEEEEETLFCRQLPALKNSHGMGAQSAHVV